MYTGGARGFESRCPAYGSLAQWTERLVTSRDVAGSSPARSAGSMVVPLAFAVCVRCGVCFGGVGSRFSACARAGGRDIMLL